MPHIYLKSAFLPAIAGAIFAFGSTAAPAPASAACNPDDCGGMSREALARDKAEIRRLNREQLRYVRKRDAEYAKGWRARRQHKQDLADYERRMAEWRDAVRRCNAGDYRYCAR
ncbi:hypothetical protein [Erythrobacter sp. THAF29]|uniref:hypothetical protein n=1 Tax=Erythrobacter sp. THAF29 TaxID=2587851 RepID=UPI0012A80B19|nr:hypothetical protein [Erythrobacter sp. THAF29]QFT78228.1 hypothetical protein FIU90_11825 [Erythrobacter sp. THAF29]